MRRKEMQSLLEERSERITLLEQRMETMNQLIDGYRAREQSVIESLSQAAETAKRHVAAAEASAQETLSDAENRASMTIQSAEERASAAVTAAETQAARLIADAEENANALVCAAQEEYARVKHQAELETADAYRRADALNRAIDRRAKELSELASEFLGTMVEMQMAQEQRVHRLEREKLPQPRQRAAAQIERDMRLPVGQKVSAACAALRRETAAASENRQLHTPRSSSSSSRCLRRCFWRAFRAAGR